MYLAGDITVPGGRVMLTNGYLADDVASEYTAVVPQNDHFVVKDDTSNHFS